MKGQQVVLVGLHVFVYYAVCNLYHSKVGNIQCAYSKLRQELLWYPDLLEMHHQQALFQISPALNNNMQPNLFQPLHDNW